MTVESRRIIPAILALAAFVGVARGASRSPGNDLVHVSVVSDVAAFRPGEAFTVGVRLKIEPGYHVYWTNPGETGLPTRVHLKLPGGMTAGPLEYPTPSRLRHTGGIVSFGYENEVMLLAKITPAAQGFKAGERITIGVNVSWLVCKEVCLPGKGNGELAVEVGSRAIAADLKLIDAWRKRMPVRLSEDVGSATVGRDGASGAWTIDIRWAREGRKVLDVFPNVDQAVAIENVEVKNLAGRSEIRFVPRLLAGQTPPAQPVDFVVTYGSDGESAGAIAIPADLRTAFETVK